MLGMVEFLPFLLFSLPAGVWVDRLRGGRCSSLADVLRAVALATVPLAYWLDALTIWQLYVVGFVVGIGTVFFDVAYQSYLPTLVERDQLIDGNSKLEISRSAAQLGGPGLARRPDRDPDGARRRARRRDQLRRLGALHRAHSHDASANRSRRIAARSSRSSGRGCATWSSTSTYAGWPRRSRSSTSSATSAARSSSSTSCASSGSARDDRARARARQRRLSRRRDSGAPRRGAARRRPDDHRLAPLSVARADARPLAPVTRRPVLIASGVMSFASCSTTSPRSASCRRSPPTGCSAG